MPGASQDGVTIARATGVCAASGREIGRGEAYVATLVENEPDAPLERRDYTVEVWAAGERPEGLFAHWRTKRPESHAARKLLVDDDELFSIFDALGEEDGERRVAFRFALALLLLRKRLLRQVGEGTGKGGRRTLLCAARGEREERVIEVERPHLTEADPAALGDELSAVLRGPA